MRRRGLTLKEFLACFVFLWFLAALLLPPGFGRGHGTRHNARKAACQNTLKQIALACQMYQKDYNGRLPLVVVSDAPDQPYGWADAVRPYLSTW
jgi:hypothetical protein